MGKGKKRTPYWLVYLQGLGLAFGLYLLSVFLLAWLTASGTLGERSAFPAVAVSCAAASLIGSFRCAGRMGKLPGGILCGAGFALLSAVIGLFVWEGLTTRGLLLPLLAVAGGMLSGMLFRNIGKKRKRRRL